MVHHVRRRGRCGGFRGGARRSGRRGTFAVVCVIPADSCGTCCPGGVPDPAGGCQRTSRHCGRDDFAGWRGCGSRYGPATRTSHRPCRPGRDAPSGPASHRGRKQSPRPPHHTGRWSRRTQSSRWCRRESASQHCDGRNRRGCERRRGEGSPVSCRSRCRGGHRRCLRAACRGGHCGQHCSRRIRRHEGHDGATAGRPHEPIERRDHRPRCHRYPPRSACVLAHQHVRTPTAHR
jgi:hypothetical protein